MTAEEVKRAELMWLKAAANKTATVTITYEEWMRQTELGLFSPRGPYTKNLDNALKKYWDGTGDFGGLSAAFHAWIDEQGRLGRNWRKSDRNKNGIIDRLYEQIMLQDAAGALHTMKNDPERWEANKALRKQQREAVAAYFKGRTLVFKDQAWKSRLTTAVNASLSFAGTPSSLRSAIEGLPSKNDIHSCVNDLLGDQNPAAIVSQLGLGVNGWDLFMHATETVFKAAIRPVLILNELRKLARASIRLRRVNKVRFDFSPGNPRAAVECVARLIDRDMDLASEGLAKNVLGTLLSAFPPGKFLFEIADPVLEFMSKLDLYSTVGEEMSKGNRLLTLMPERKEVDSDLFVSSKYTLDLFNASPVLGCCFLCMASVGVWLNFPVEYWGEQGFMDTMEEIAERADYVRRRAREYIRLSKYALSGTEYLGWQPQFISGQRWEFLGAVLNTRPDQVGVGDLIAGKFRQPGPLHPSFQRQGAVRNLNRQ